MKHRRSALLHSAASIMLAVAVAACANAGADTGGVPDAAGIEIPNAAAATQHSDESNGSMRASDDASDDASERQPPHSDRVPNIMGRVPILEYHLIGDTEGRWQRSYEGFRKDLEMLHARGYRPVNMADLVDGVIDLPAGYSPVVFTFDDASPSQFRFIEKDGALAVDSLSALGIWLEFRRSHPDWKNRAVFCMLSGAEAGRSFFGDKGKEAQKSEWRHRKLRMLVDSGFELCNHTVWHANLAKQSDSVVMEQIARLNLAIDSAVPGYKVRTFALPLGEWPKNRELARAGSWTDPKSGRTIAYSFDVILEVAGGAARSPHDSAFHPLRAPRVQVLGNELERLLDQLERNNQRYVSDGLRRRAAGTR